MGTYYCFIAGLPDISIDDAKINYSVKSFRTELDDVLSDNDRRLIELFYLKFDNDNIIKLLESNEKPFDERGIYSEEELLEMISLVKEFEIPTDNRFPSFFYRFTLAFLNEKPFNENLSWQDQLACLYYQYAINCNNQFVSKWFEMNLNVNNMLAAIACRKYNFDTSNVVLGSSEISETIRQSGQRDMGLVGMIEYLEAILRIGDEGDLKERERRLDIFRWNWLEEQSFFNYFTIERVFGYLIKVEILERWVALDPQNGKRIFRELINTLKKEIQLPTEFNK